LFAVRGLNALLCLKNNLEKEEGDRKRGKIYRGTGSTLFFIGDI